MNRLGSYCCRGLHRDAYGSWCRARGYIGGREGGEDKEEQEDKEEGRGGRHSTGGRERGRLDTEGKKAAAEVFRARKGLEIFTVVNSGCFAMVQANGTRLSLST